MIFISMIIGFVLSTGEAEFFEIVWQYGLKWLVIAALAILSVAAAKTAISAWRNIWR